MSTASGSTTMNKLLVGIVVVFVVFSVFQLVQINSLKKSLGIAGAGTASKQVSAKSSGGETYEAMMARMHPDQYAASKGSSSNAPSISSNAPSMVGGC